MSKASTKRPTVSKRLATLELEFAALREQVLGHPPVKKDWKSTVGSLPDDAMTRRAFKLGARWSKAARGA
ncbi:hypothetical protein [Prosthecobacter sp.]|uniref:hypothetical protein n=1 Tax=Prosthecobacter sp. TaxID=1965333 RepID=UPI00378403E5